MATVQFPQVTVSELISLLQAAQAEGYGAFPVLLGPPDGELRPVTVVEHIVSEGVLLRALSPELRALALTYWDAPFDTQDEDDALNAFCMAAELAMTQDQRDEWNSWCLKATGDEIVNEALRILGMEQLTRETQSRVEATAV